MEREAAWAGAAVLSDDFVLVMCDDGLISESEDIVFPRRGKQHLEITPMLSCGHTPISEDCGMNVFASVHVSPLNVVL